MFETGLNTCSSYIICRKGIVMEFQYLKLIFKSRRSSIDIWGAIILGLKGSVYFLKKESYMNLDIYINLMLKWLELPFHNQCIKEKGFMIQMNNNTSHYISKIIIIYYHYIRLIYIDQLIQSLDLNSIKNLQRIIKLQINT